MPSLKDLKNRIDSVKSTRKITSAMKMVAAAKLKRAQEQAEQTRPYATAMSRLLASLAAGARTSGENLPKLLRPDLSNKDICLVVVTSDRGLCGAFNSSVVREAKRQIKLLQAEGRTVKLSTIGRKGREALRRDYASLMLADVAELGRKRLSMDDVNIVQAKLLPLFENGTFDRAYIIYNQFKSAMTQITVTEQLLPAMMPANDGAASAMVEFEPDAGTLLADLMPRATALAIFRVLLESAAGEQGARMTAMDNATRNAGDMINKLTLVYNRTRQAYITKELIEIISGAEAV
jgi:F-type H+-transporting ATPase subunit gamma